MEEEKNTDRNDSENLRLAMETGTLPPAGELERYFLPSIARQMLPLALQLESAVRRMHNPTGSVTRHLDPFAAKWLEKRERNTALTDIADIRYRIQLRAHRLLQTAYCVTFPRPYKQPGYLEDVRQRRGTREWAKVSRKM